MTFCGVILKRPERIGTTFGGMSVISSRFAQPRIARLGLRQFGCAAK